jgi:SAM-dependent methyltransferase
MSARTIEAIWQTYDAMEARLTAPVSDRMIALASLGPGARVLDLATGRGEPAIRAAKTVGDTGRVVGVDPAGALLDLARARAAAENVHNLELHTCDAETLTGVPDGPYDAVLVRWGLMFLRDPLAALRAATARLVDGGAFVAAFWGPPEEVSWYSLPRAVLATYRPIPPIDPTGPGVFRYASAEVVARDFAAAGLRIERLEERHVDVLETSDEEVLVAWCRAFGLDALIESAGLSPEVQLAWEHELIEATRALSPDGRLRLGGTTSLVLARPTERA